MCMMKFPKTNPKGYWKADCRSLSQAAVAESEVTGILYYQQFSEDGQKFPIPEFVREED